MKTKVMPVFRQLEKADLQELTAQVREELANDVTFSPAVPKKKKFGRVDLWNCRRKIRTAGIIIR